MNTKLISITLVVFVSILFGKTVQAQNFVHPGLPFTINDLERMKANRTSVTPWKESWNIIMRTDQASLDYVMQGPAEDVENKGNDNIYISDVTAMLYHALQYYFTGDEAHAELAVSLIEPWATTHKTWSGTSAHLGAAWRGGTMAQACEILRHTYPGWTDELTIVTEDYFLEVFWPLFRLPNPLRAANQGANNLMGAMYVAIYCNDQEKYDMCVDAFLNDACGGISNTLPNGQNGDTGRDQGHAMGMIGNLATVCELAWAQGLDLFAALNDRLLAVHEYWCKYNLGYNVEYIGFGTCYDYYPTIGSDGRNPSSESAIPATEMVYGAYAVRKGLSAPYVTQYRQAVDIDENTFLFAKDESFMTTAPFNHAPNPELTISNVTDLTGVDIGSVNTAGTETYNNDTWTVDGAGSNVYGGNNDAFHYSYIKLSGDASIIAKVNSIENTSSSAKAAVVIRENLNANSKMATMSLTAAGSAYNSRGFVAADGNGSLSDGDVPVPFWIKIERRRENIAGYVSPDGVNWAAMQNTLFAMTEDYYIGLGVSSGNSNTLCTSVFSDVQYGVLGDDAEYIGAYSQIESENYSAMSGITTEPTSDVSGVENVTSITADDWMEYELNVLYSGMYSMDYRVASASNNGDLLLSVGDETLEQVMFPATGGEDVWTTVRSTTPFYLTKGVQILKVKANSDDWKINWMRLLSGCKDVPLIPYVETIDSLGVSLGSEASTHLTIFPGNTAVLKATVTTAGEWSWTGPNEFTSTKSEVTFEDVAKDINGEYIVNFVNDCGLESTDTFTINVVDSYYFEAEDYTAMEGVSTEATDDVSGTFHVTDISSGDWMEYEIYVPFSALYNINYRIKSQSAGLLSTSTDGDELEQVSFDAVDWTTVISSSPVFLKEGLQTIRISSLSGNWKLNWVELVGIQTVKPCALPYEGEGFRIFNTNLNWTSGALDITCETEIDVHVSLQSLLNFADGDYLNVYYKLDGGEKVTVAEIVGKVTEPMVSATKLSGKTLEVIIESNVGTAGIYDVNGILVLKSSDPFARIEAEDYDENNGGCTEKCSDTGGGYSVGCLNDGHWLKFSNINLSDVNAIDARLANRSSGGTVEIRLDSEAGKLIGTLVVPNTGGWQNWQTAHAELDKVVGFYDVFLVFKRASGYVGNINWIELLNVPTGVKNITREEGIILYPNPFEESLTIEGHANAQVEIYNTTGLKVFEGVLQSDKHTISMQGLDKGMYILKMLKDGSTKTSKLIKQ